ASNACVLVIDDPKPAVLRDHQICGVKIPVTKDRSPAFQLLGQLPELCRDRMFRCLIRRAASVCGEVVLKEKVELPQKLFDIEPKLSRDRIPAIGKRGRGLYLCDQRYGLL